MWAGFGERPIYRRPNYVGQDVVKEECDVACHFLANNDEATLDTADAVVIEQIARGKWNTYEYLRNPLHLPERRGRAQAWVNFGYETPRYFPVLARAAYLQQFSINMSFDMQYSPVPITFTCNWAGSSWEDYLRLPRHYDAQKVAAVMTSNCNRGGAEYRSLYMHELMQYIPVDSYGKCFHNAQVPESMQRPIYADHGQAMTDKQTLYEGYAFALAFENSNTTDYVSEKLWNAFLSGVVPIYMGTSTIDEWLPGEHSVIRTDKFDSPRSLAKYLTYLLQNRTAYEEYFEWKRRGLSEKFKYKASLCAFTSADCRLCKYVAKRREEQRRRMKRGGDKGVIESRSRVRPSLPRSSTALILDGQHRILHVDLSLRLGLLSNLNALSLLLWIHPYARLDTGDLVARPMNWRLGLENVRYRSYVQFCIGSQQKSCALSMRPINRDSWTHIAVSFSESYARIYIDGQLDIESESLLVGSLQQQHLQQESSSSSSSILYIGSQQYTGLIDDVSIWRRALSGDELRPLLFERLDGDEEGLELYFPFHDSNNDNQHQHSTIESSSSDKTRGLIRDYSVNALHAVVGGGGSARYTFVPTKPLHFTDS